MKRKTKSIILIVAMTLAILLLATAVTASLTNGFKNSNPYGWLENFDRIKKDTELNGFEVCKDFELDFAKLIKGVKATEDTAAGTKTYSIVKTDTKTCISTLWKPLQTKRVLILLSSTDKTFALPQTDSTTRRLKQSSLAILAK